MKWQPMVRHDLPQFEALLQFVESKVDDHTGRPPHPCVYLLSSSELLNSSSLWSADLQFQRPMPVEAYIYNTHDIDRRDGFPDDLVSASLVLVADPLQTQFDQGQNVITVPARMFLNQEGFAEAFVRDSQTFQLDNGIRVYAYERMRPSTPQEIEQLHELIGLSSKK
jgi:hypothetical protein